MLTKITIERFKSLSKVELDLGQFNLFIGTNASGKSNLLDALRVLQGVGYGFTVTEIFDGKPKGSSSIAWDGIRGGSAGAVLKVSPSQERKSFKAVIRLAIQLVIGEDHYEYEIGLNPTLGIVQQEGLCVNGIRVFETIELSKDRDEIIVRVRRSDLKDKDEDFVEVIFSPNLPVLHQSLELDSESLPFPGMREVTNKCLTELSNVQRFELSPAVLREYSQRQNVDRLGERGENFAALVNTICAKKQTRAEYVSWLRELTPAEVDDVVILKGAVKEPLFALKEGKNTFPAQILSDGTLRFAALAAALFQPDAPGLLLLEEIENGIHPTRLRLLVELLRSRAKLGKPQVLATTHSPIVLAWLKPEEYSHTFFCLRDERGISHIQPVSSLPQFESIIKRTPISDLFAEGWLESAL